MSIEITPPEFPESVDEGTIIAWAVEDGSAVSRDDKLADVETDKVVLEVFAASDGVLTIVKGEGDIVHRGDVIATIDPKGAAAKGGKSKKAAPAAKEAAPAKAAPAAPAASSGSSVDPADLKGLSPSKRRQALEHGVESVRPSAPAAGGAKAPKPIPIPDTGVQRRVPMSQIRRRIAQRLKQVQDTAAILTTFNEVNMKPVMDIRSKYKDRFQEDYGTKLGFMSFFVKATVEALKKTPSINAMLDDRDIVYNEEFHIGIAVDSPRGLVVPVVRNADRLGFADIERTIRDYGMRAKDAKLQYEELVGGTFTITNGGVFGSMLSTPIINAPQSAILGMHNIVQRPWVENGEVVVRPIMYLALSYDHRVVDGRGAVEFLVNIKNSLEDPSQLLLQL